MTKQDLPAYRNAILARRAAIVASEQDYPPNGRLQRHYLTLAAFEFAADYHLGALTTDDSDCAKGLAEEIGIDLNALKWVPEVSLRLGFTSDCWSTATSDRQ